MGKFIVDAFCAIKCVEKRRIVIKQLSELGYKELGVSFHAINDCIQIMSGYYQCKDNEWLVRKCNQFAIDCNLYANGDEDLAVKLFIRLADMRDDELIGVPIPLHIASKLIGGELRELTPLELAEAVRDGKIKL